LHKYSPADGEFLADMHKSLLKTKKLFAIGSLMIYNAKAYMRKHGK
jgi:hypothetical protein